MQRQGSTQPHSPAVHTLPACSALHACMALAGAVHGAAICWLTLLSRPLFKPACCSLRSDQIDQSIAPIVLFHEYDYKIGYL
jgi:hypothetical protein